MTEREGKRRKYPKITDSKEITRNTEPKRGIQLRKTDRGEKDNKKCDKKRKKTDVLKTGVQVGRGSVFVNGRVTGVDHRGKLRVKRGSVREKKIVEGDSEVGGSGVRGKRGRRKRRRGRVSLVCHGVFRQPEQQGQPG